VLCGSGPRPRCSTHWPQTNPRPPRGRSVDVPGDRETRSAKRHLTPVDSHATARWTFGGRRGGGLPPGWTTELAQLQELLRSPLADSNRRPPLYEEGPCV